MYAPTSRFRLAEDFAALIDACHPRRFGVLLDWVPGHSRTIRTASAVSTAPRFMSTQSAAGRHSTGVR